MFIGIQIGMQMIGGAATLDDNFVRNDNNEIILNDNGDQVEVG